MGIHYKHLFSPQKHILWVLTRSTSFLHKNIYYGYSLEAPLFYTKTFTVGTHYRHLFSPQKHILWVFILSTSFLHKNIYCGYSLEAPLFSQNIYYGYSLEAPVFYTKTYNVSTHYRHLFSPQKHILWVFIISTSFLHKKHILWVLTRSTSFFTKHILWVLTRSTSFLHKNIYCGYSLEAPQKSTHNICFCTEVRKIFIWTSLMHVSIDQWHSKL